MNQKLNHPEVVTFGESMALFMPDSARGIEYASRLEMSFGGAESNVSIGLARLGHGVGWFGWLGQDPLGRMILKKIRGEGVDVSEAVLTPESTTGLMLREQVSGKSSVYYHRKCSAASRMTPADLPVSYIARAKLLHVTGITAAISRSGYETLTAAIDIARDNGVKIFFDPNLRLKLWSLDEAREALLALAQKADYFVPGMDELKLLYSTDDFRIISENLRRLPGISIVKGGCNETLLVRNDSIVSVPYYKSESVVDTVGAGDGFCAGLIAGILRGYKVENAIRLGNLVGSFVVQSVGDWEGLPTWEQVDAVLQRREHVER